MNNPPRPPRPLGMPSHDSPSSQPKSNNAEPNPFLVSNVALEQAESQMQPLEGAPSRGNSAPDTLGALTPSPSISSDYLHAAKQGTSGYLPVDRRLQGAPLRVDPTVVVPHYKDPDAEFRRGSWRKPLAFVLLAAGFITALVVLVPSKPPAESQRAEGELAPAAIGTSVAPEIRVLNEGAESKQRLRPLAKKVASPENTQGAKVISRKPEGSFADAFNAGAKP